MWFYVFNSIGLMLGVLRQIYSEFLQTILNLQIVIEMENSTYFVIVNKYRKYGIRTV